MTNEVWGIEDKDGKLLFIFSTTERAAEERRASFDTTMPERAPYSLAHFVRHDPGTRALLEEAVLKAAREYVMALSTFVFNEPETRLDRLIVAVRTLEADGD